MAEYADIPYLGPPRWYGNYRTDKRYVAIHATANTATARGEASYATRRADSTSSHYYVDAVELVQSLHTDLVAWHAGNQEGNTYGIAYEITGLNAWTRQQWLDRVAWGPLARQIVRDCVKHRIEPRWLSIAEMRAGTVTGLVTHNDMRLAWAGTDHTDPGPNFPKDHLIALVRSALNGDDMDATQDAKLTNANANAWAVATLTDPVVIPGNTPGAAAKTETNRLRVRLDAIDKTLAELKARPPVQSAPVDPAVVQSAVQAALSNPDALAAIAKAVADENARRQQA